MFVFAARPRYVRGLNMNQLLLKRTFKQSSWTWWNSQSTIPPLQPPQQPNTGSGNSIGYEVAVAYHAKEREGVNKASIESPTGEDNYFVAVRNSEELYAGVTDGVGGWALYGYDSCAISRHLCEAMEWYVTESKKPIMPIDLLAKGFKKVQDDKIVEAGGTTAVVARFSSQGLLDVANLGDSWCGVFRAGKLQFQTAFQTINFNTPYQLSVYPPEMSNDGNKQSSDYRDFTAMDADEYSFRLQKGDIVVLATDGVTDNVCTEDMELFLADHMENSEISLQALTEKFVSLVHSLSRDEGFPSVFAQELSKVTGRSHIGGKEDDITVVVVKAT